MAVPFDEFGHPRGYAGKFAPNPGKKSKKKRKGGAIPSKKSLLAKMQGKTKTKAKRPPTL